MLVKKSPFLRWVLGAVPLALAAAAVPAPASAASVPIVQPAGASGDLVPDTGRRSPGPAGDPVLCPVDDLSVPESAGGGVVSEWIAYGESLTVSPYPDQIWAGVWFTGWNGPEGWTSTSAPSSYPAPGVPEYSLVGRLGNGGYGYVGASQRTYTNTTPGFLQRVRFRVNDNTPGNGDGAFRVFLRYPCH